MNWFNSFYFAVLLVGVALFVLLRPEFNTQLSFYGFAESNETDINYNYPVIVDRILVTPGQAVGLGDTILMLTRRKSRDILNDQQYKIAELRAEERYWKRRKENDLQELKLSRDADVNEIDLKLDALNKELKYKEGLAKELKSISIRDAQYQPLQDEIQTLTSEKEDVIKKFDLRISNLSREIDAGESPFREQIRRLEAEREFEADQQVQQIVVTAPADGLIGTIDCKEEEHIPSYTTLLTFYEPHSGLIKGFVHEDLTPEVHINDSFRISSLKDDQVTYDGKVVGLGSRIVEIPTRLRKHAEIKTYGREVLIEITVDNSFLQKEKVSISPMN